MPVFKAGNLGRPVRAGSWGNRSSAHGVVDQNAGATTADTLEFCIVPAGARLVDAQLWSGAGGASAAISLGYEPVESDGPAANASYFFSAADISAAARVRADGVTPPITLDGPVKIVGTLTGGTFASNVDVQVVVEYDFEGNP